MGKRRFEIESTACPICHRNFYPPKKWGKAVCPGCYTPTKRKKGRPRSKPKIKQETKGELAWHVVLLDAEEPIILKRIIGKERAQAFADAVRHGEIHDHLHLKDSKDIRVWEDTNREYIEDE